MVGGPKGLFTMSPVGKFIANSSKKTKMAPPIVLSGWASGKGGVEVLLISMDNFVGRDYCSESNMCEFIIIFFSTHRVQIKVESMAIFTVAPAMQLFQ